MVRGKCYNCGKPLEFGLTNDLGDWSIEENIPYLASLTLDGTIIHCSGCKKYSVFEYHHGSGNSKIVKAPKAEGRG